VCQAGSQAPHEADLFDYYTTAQALILATPVQYRPISDLAEPAIRGAGVRINPRNNGHHLFV
jgi:hypothetical protein